MASMLGAGGDAGGGGRPGKTTPATPTPTAGHSDRGAILHRRSLRARDFWEQWLSLSRIAESFGHAAQRWSVRSRRSAVQRDVGLCACCGLARCCAPVGLLPGLYDGPAG